MLHPWIPKKDGKYYILDINGDIDWKDISSIVAFNEYNERFLSEVNAKFRSITDDGIVDETYQAIYINEISIDDNWPPYTVYNHEYYRYVIWDTDIKDRHVVVNDECIGSINSIQSNDSDRDFAGDHYMLELPTHLTSDYTYFLYSPKQIYNLILKGVDVKEFLYQLEKARILGIHV